MTAFIDGMLNGGTRLKTMRLFVIVTLMLMSLGVDLELSDSEGLAWS